MRAPSKLMFPILLFCRLTLSACGTGEYVEEDAFADETRVTAEHDGNASGSVLSAPTATLGAN